MYVSLFGLYLSFVVLIIYFSTESWWWHSSQAAESMSSHGMAARACMFGAARL